MISGDGNLIVIGSNHGQLKVGVKIWLVYSIHVHFNCVCVRVCVCVCVCAREGVG